MENCQKSGEVMCKLQLQVIIALNLVFANIRSLIPFLELKATCGMFKLVRKCDPNS